MDSFPLADTGPLLRTYSGVLDDVMVRYGKGREFLKPEYFNKMVLKNVIFGSGMFLNDGYLVNHPMARKFLGNYDSLLSLMISTGFVRILSRQPDAGSLASMPETMARKGNRSFQELIQSAEWTQSVGPAFRKMARAVFHNGTVRPWPRYDMSEGFCKLMDRALIAHPEDIGLTRTNESDLKRIADNFRERTPQKGNARDAFEKAATDVNKRYEADFDERMDELMEVANQAYHYNFGMTLSAEEKTAVAADTTKGMAFDELLSLRKVERAQIDHVPLIRFPEEIPMDDGALFLPFIRAEHPLSEAKREYMQSLSDLLVQNARNISDLASNARAATEQYKRRMEEHFSPLLGKIAVDDAFAGSASLGMSKDLNHTAATAAPTAHIAIEMHKRSLNESRRFLVEQFEIVDETPQYSSAEKGSDAVKIGDLRSQLASIAFDAEAAAIFTKDMGTFDHV